ncbi:MAG: hypothetical protein NUK63_04430 [Candidatus Bathyarchaeum tardum]|nr:MAG: hypothetical protein NUK63_04430 [Candidatus Bathyarchaeum tardum]
MKFDSEEKRVAIPASTKKEVYSRAKGKCESCGTKMKMTGDGGDFHHTRKPSVKSRPSSIQFLCAVCHRRYGHAKRTKIVKNAFGTVIEKKVTITRRKVGKHKQ